MSQDFIPAAKPIIGDEERAAVDAVLRLGMLAQGTRWPRSRQEFSAVLLDGRACVAVNSGTSGLHLGLLAAGVGPGDEVIVPSFTFAATANSVALTGATPVFADIEPDHYCLDPAAVEAADHRQTKAIMPVHLYGHPADDGRARRAGDRARPAIFTRTPPRPTARRCDGTPVGTLRQVRHVQPVPDQEHDLGRRRHGLDVATPSVERSAAAAAQPGHGDASTKTSWWASTPA